MKVNKTPKAAKVSKNDIWIDSEGNKIPVKYIDQAVMERSCMVDDIFKEILDLNEKMKELKARVMIKIDDYIQKTTQKENWRGNIQFYNFGCCRRIDVNMIRNIGFNEKLQSAKELILKCVERWGSSAEKLKILVNKIFKLDKQGNIDSKLVLSLQGYDFPDPEWKEAMLLINDSIFVKSSKKYISFYHKTDSSDAMEQVILNFSRLDNE